MVERDTNWRTVILGYPYFDTRTQVYITVARRSQPKPFCVPGSRTLLTTDQVAAEDIQIIDGITNPICYTRVRDKVLTMNEKTGETGFPPFSKSTPAIQKGSL